jgi:hypothetical protein
MLAGSARRAVAVAFPEAEKTLVELARTLPFEDFVQALRRWEELVDEEAAEDQAQRDHQARRVHLSQTFRGNFVLDGQLEVLGGTELATALATIEREARSCMSCTRALAMRCRPDECQGDHIVPWPDGGPTTQDNGQLLCGSHNRWRIGRPTGPTDTLDDPDDADEIDVLSGRSP